MQEIEEKIDRILHYMELLEANYSVIEGRLKMIDVKQEWYIAVLAELNPEFNHRWSEFQSDLEHARDKLRP